MSEDGLNETSTANNNSSSSNETTIEEAAEIPITYTVFVPIFIGACAVTFFMNAVILAAFPFIRNLSRVSEEER